MADPTSTPIDAARACIAVIPARGGSKGLPGKNVAEVGGVPLIARTVRAAREVLPTVVVSTDDDRIAEAAQDAGAQVVRRPADLAGDTASSESAVLHALDALDQPDDAVVAFLQCTSPFTTGQDVADLVAPVLDGTADATFTATAFHAFVWRPRADDGPAGVNHDESLPRARRQDRPEELVETGNGYAFTAGGLRASGSRFHGRLRPVVIPAAHHHEVDDPADLLRARALVGDHDPGPLPAPDLLVMDFDGVFTDDGVWVDQDGVESVRCHRGDGMGLSALAGRVPMVVLSTEVNAVVSARCAKLGLECRQGLGHAKGPALAELLATREVDPARTMYVGNDRNDLACMAQVGWPVAPADARPEVRRAARVVLARGGGHGALRELTDRIASTLDQRTPHA